MRNRRLLVSEHDTVLNMAEQGISINRISLSLGVPRGAVSKVIREKYPNRNERKILPNKTIVSSYKAGDTMETLAERYSTTITTIKNRLVDAGVEIRTIAEIQRVHHFNEDFFETIDTPAKSYWLGFMFADGCILSNRKDVQLSLSTKDKNHLKKFLSAIDYDGDSGVKDYVGTGYGVEVLYSRVLLRSEKMCQDLIDKGCIPLKSLDLDAPVGVPEKYHHDFIRGVVDGDGYISGHGFPALEIVGTYSLLSWVSDVMHLSSPTPHKNIWRLRSSGRKAVECMKMLYSENSISLDRKYEKAVKNVK